MVESGYNITHIDDIETLLMADIDEVEEEYDAIGVKNLDEQELGTENMKAKIWEIPPGERMGIHGHSEQEEFYFILDGTFEVSLGPPGQTESYEVQPGGAFSASPEVALGYENISQEVGRVLVVAAPRVEERGIPEAELIE